MQSKGFWAAAKKVRPSHVDLSCESEPDFGGHNNNRKQRADRTAPETRGSIFCGVFPGQRTRRNLFNLINFPQFKLMRERDAGREFSQASSNILQGVYCPLATL